MDWNECLQKFVKDVEIDEYRIKSLIEKALQRKEIIDKIYLNEKTVSFIVEGYYEVIKELLVAYLLSEGKRSKNHQCLITYFYRKNSELEGEIKLISQMSYYRNRLNYYGESVPLFFYKDNEKEIPKIIKIINNLIKN